MSRGAPLLVGLLLAACAAPLADLRDDQAAGNFAAITADAAEVERVCRDDPEQCAQLRAVLGHACLGEARALPAAAARARLDCAVDQLDAALDAGLPPTVGGRGIAVYEASRLEALDRRIGLSESAAAAESDRRALSREAEAFAAKYPRDWRGPFYGGQAELQRANALAGDPSAGAAYCAADARFREAAGRAAAAGDARAADRVETARRALGPRASDCAGTLSG